MKAYSQTPLPDQEERDRFCQALNRNFSVIAPAGVGKTTAIVSRIAEIANKGEAGALERLVVVTYTVKAADEMRERVRQRLLESGRRATERLVSFNKAYFGTIHGYCLQLLGRWGHFLGLPPALELVADSDALWLEFLAAQDAYFEGVPATLGRDLSRYVDIRRIAALARTLSTEREKPALPQGSCPLPELSALLAFEAKRKNSIPVVRRHQEQLRQWRERNERQEPWVG